MAIPIGIEGRILNSDHSLHVVLVHDDNSNSEGLLILELWTDSDGPNPRGAFDSWVESIPALEPFFKESGWAVRWNGNPP